MVRIALAGGTGSKFDMPSGLDHVFVQGTYTMILTAISSLPDVGREILDGLVAKGTHELVVFSRSVWNNSP
jgi:hypothetical protein